MKNILRALAGFVTMAVVCSPAVGGKVFLRTPEASWDQLRPYLEANLRVEHRDGGLWVGLSGATRERDLFEPYDDVMGEWATVLLGQLLSDKKLARVAKTVAHQTARDLPTLSEMARSEVTRHYWERLEDDGRFLERLRKLYDSAQASRRLRCLICEEGFEPKYLRPLY